MLWRQAAAVIVLQIRPKTIPNPKSAVRLYYTFITMYVNVMPASGLQSSKSPSSRCFRVYQPANSTSLLQQTSIDQVYQLRNQPTNGMIISKKSYPPQTSRSVNHHMHFVQRNSVTWFVLQAQNYFNLYSLGQQNGYY